MSVWTLNEAKKYAANLPLNRTPVVNQLTNKGAEFTTYVAVKADKTMAANGGTYRGWASRHSYLGETFRAVKVWVNTEIDNAELKCSVHRDDFSAVASTTKVKDSAGYGWIIFIFDHDIDSTMLTDANMFLSVEVVAVSGCRIIVDAGSNSRCTGEAGHENKYLVLDATDWRGNYSSPNNNSIPAEFISADDLVLPVTDTVTWYKELALPPTIYGVVGKEVNIYFDNLVADDVSRYKVNVTCTKGKQQNERWTFTPTAAGTWPLTIDVYDEYFNLVMTGNSTVVAVEATAQTGVNKTCLFIGDSITNAGVYTGELLTLAAADVMDVTLIGTRGTAPNLHQGHPGWQVYSFYSTVESPFRFDGVFDFSQYMTANSFPTVDYVFIHLGTNDVLGEPTDERVNTFALLNAGYIESMITSFKTFHPTIKVGIMTTIPPSYCQDAFGAVYNSGQTQWRYKRNIIRYVKMMIDTFKGREAENIYLVPTNVNLDTVNNMNTSAEAPINSRTAKTIVRQSDAVHPATEGYYQMADTVFYFLKNV